MPKIQVVDKAGKKTSDIELSDAIFAIEPNMSVMHLAVVAYLANQRQGTQSTLTRSEVSGGGRKPWRQKGTGHARQGSIRAPQWIHGGVALGPKTRDYGFSLIKKERKLAIKSALSSKVTDNAVIVLDKLEVEDYSTKTVVNCLNAIGTGKKTLIVLADANKVVIKSAANIAGVKTAQVNTINTYDILNADSVVIVKDAVKTLEEVYA